ncbi:mRNA splicing protein [Penicillium taxi]|uniref:mRNA splicing protein n=1 Tax=Penicillium taxi TaxID=168475 RepID=UPI002544FA6F|nr:mRNA splicing protein [Penicillium taxi]KAJ5909108.1 mRNA splicing protein [Penicillium taxi]
MSPPQQIQDLLDKPKNELTEYEVSLIEEYELSSGPLSLLETAARNNLAVLVSTRQDRKIHGRVKAFDRHCNLVMESCKEIWTEKSKGPQSRGVNKERYISKL